jgi:hypothetical protein
MREDAGDAATDAPGPDEGGEAGPIESEGGDDASVLDESSPD